MLDTAQLTCLGGLLFIYSHIPTRAAAVIGYQRSRGTQRGSSISARSFTRNLRLAACTALPTEDASGTLETNNPHCFLLRERKHQQTRGRSEHDS